MGKKRIAVILEIIPVISAVVTILLLFSDWDSEPIRKIIWVTMLLAFLGFVFFFIGRGLAKGDRLVRALGILDWLATICVIGLYVLAIFSFGL